MPAPGVEVVVLGDLDVLPARVLCQQAPGDVVVAAAEALEVVGALVLADDSLPAPDEVRDAEEAAVVVADLEVELGLGQARPHEEQSGAALHRRARADPDPPQRLAEHPGASGPGAPTEGLGEGRHRAQPRGHRVAEHHEVVEPEQLRQVAPGVGHPHDGHAMSVGGLARLQAAVGEALGPVDAVAAARAHGVQRPEVLAQSRHGQAEQGGGRAVRERDVVRQHEPGATGQRHGIGQPARRRAVRGGAG